MKKLDIERLSRWLIPLGAFFLSLGAMLVACIAMGIAPLGDRTVVVADGISQYIHFHAYWQRVLAGDQSAFFSLLPALGNNMLPMIAYYLASPLSLIVAFFDSPSALPHALLLITLLKIGLCGATYAIFARTVLGARRSSLLFAPCYALCSYAMCYACNIMWLDTLILLPLVIRGVHTLVTRGRWFGLVLALAAMFFTQFYLAYMGGIFALLCFLAMLWVYRPARPWRVALKFFAATCCAALCCAPLLLPAALRILQDSGPSLLNVDPGWKTMFPFFDVFSRTFFGAFDSITGGMPPLYSGTMVLLLLPVYFLNARIPKRERIAFGCICAFMLLSFWAAMLNFAWEAFDAAMWYQGRFAFVFCFLLVWCAHRCFTRMNGIRVWSVVASGTLALLYLLVFHPNQFPNTLPIARTLAPCLVAFWTVALLWLRLVPKGRRVALALCVLLLTTEASANAYVTMRSLDAANHYMSLSGFTNFFAQRATLLAQLPDDPEDPYRVESTVGWDANDSLTLGYNGVKTFSSAADTVLGNTLIRLGQDGQSTNYRYTGSNIALDSLLGIRYVLASESPNDYYYDIVEQDGLHVYENPAALPLAFATRAAVMDYHLPPQVLTKTDYGAAYLRENLFALQGGMFDALQDEGGPPILQPLPMTVEYEMLLSQTLPDGAERVTVEEGFFDNPAKRYQAVTQTDGPVYAYWASDYEGGAGQFIMETYMPYRRRLLQQLDNYAVPKAVRIGDYGPDEELALAFLQEGKVTTLRQQALYQLDYAALETLTDEACAAQLYDLSWHGHRLSGTVDATDAHNTLLLTVPYDGGWQAMVNGTPVRVERGLDIFCAVPLTQGRNEVRMVYTPPGLIAGFWLCALGIAGCLLALVIGRLRFTSSANRVAEHT